MAQILILIMKLNAARATAFADGSVERCPPLPVAE